MRAGVRDGCDMSFDGLLEGGSDPNGYQAHAYSPRIDLSMVMPVQSCGGSEPQPVIVS